MANERILAVGKIVDGDVQWHISPLPADEPQACPVRDGLLQQLIDEAEMAEDYESWLEDVDFFRSGC